MKSNVFVYACLLCVSTLVVCCSNERFDTEDNHEKKRIELFIPDAQDIQLYSTATTMENYIRDCYVVIFEGSGVYKNAEKVDVSKIAKNGSAVVLLPQTSFDLDLEDKIYVVCNTGLTTLPVGIHTESDMNDKFKPAKDYYFGGEPLPMSGNAKWTTSSSTVTLTRAVAKVQVKLDGGFNIGGEGSVPEWNDYMKNFDESKCGFVVGNYGGKSNIMQNPIGLSQNLSGLSAFYGTTSENKFMRFLQYADSEEDMTIYISEYPSSIKDCEGNTIADGVFNDKRLFMLMIDSVASGTAVVGNGMTTNAWRLDFYDAANKKYLDIKRNYHYTFVVRKIRSTPYVCSLPSAQSRIGDVFTADGEVLHNPGSNIEYTVYVQEDWANYNYSNGQYALSISTDTISDPDIPFKLKVQIPSGVDNSQIDTHILNVYNNGQPVGNPGTDIEVSGYTNASAGINFPTDGTETTLRLIINDYDNLNDAHMIIKLGNIYKKVPIVPGVQPEPWIYMPDPGFREYCNLKGFLSEINPSDNNYVRLSAAGIAADTITIQRNAIPFGISCAATVTLPSDIDISQYLVVYDLTGLEAFINLEYLYVGGNNITTIDVSANTKLKALSTYGSPIISANLSNNKELFVIFFSIYGNLNTLDISHCSPDMCFVGGGAKELILTAEQVGSIGAGFLSNFPTKTIVSSPY